MTFNSFAYWDCLLLLVLFASRGQPFLHGINIYVIISSCCWSDIGVIKLKIESLSTPQGREYNSFKQVYKWLWMVTLVQYACLSLLSLLIADTLFALQLLVNTESICSWAPKVLFLRVQVRAHCCRYEVEYLCTTWITSGFTCTEVHLPFFSPVMLYHKVLW